MSSTTTEVGALIYVRLCYHLLARLNKQAGDVIEAQMTIRDHTWVFKRARILLGPCDSAYCDK
jgi:hypothetical protein